MGRRSIPIQPIRDERNRAVTFVKRKAGLFKKAHELSVLCQVDIALVIVGGNGKIFEFSSSSVDQVMRSYKKSDVQEHKTTKDFQGGKVGFHSRNSSAVDSEDDWEADGEGQGSGAGGAAHGQGHGQGGAGHGAAHVHGSPGGAGAGAGAGGASAGPPAMANSNAASAGAPGSGAFSRPKLTVQIPVAAKKEPWRPGQRMDQQQQRGDQQHQQGQPQPPQPQQLAHLVAPQPGISPTTGPYFAQMLVNNGEPTPVSTTLPSKYMNDVIQSPNNLFTSEWGVPWSANPNSGFMRPGQGPGPGGRMDMHMPGQGQQGQPQGPGGQGQGPGGQGQGPGGQGPGQGGPGGPGGHPMMHPLYQMPPNTGLYSGGMPSAGVQTMFQSSPVQFTPNDAKRKPDEQLGPEGKKAQF